MDNHACFVRVVPIPMLNDQNNYLKPMPRKKRKKEILNTSTRSNLKQQQSNAHLNNREEKITSYNRLSIEHMKKVQIYPTCFFVAISIMAAHKAFALFEILGILGWSRLR